MNPIIFDHLNVGGVNASPDEVKTVRDGAYHWPQYKPTDADAHQWQLHWFDGKRAGAPDAWDRVAKYASAHTFSEGRPMTLKRIRI